MGFLQNKKVSFLIGPGFDNFFFIGYEEKGCASGRFYFHVFKIVISYKVQIKYLFSMLNFIFLCFLGVLYLVWLNFHMK
jgi:hypothetical protein